jgi:hypothetical protein
MPSKTRYPILRAKFPRCVDYRTGKLGCIQVDGRRNGNGRREYFTDAKQALVRAEQLATQLLNQGTAALGFTPRQRELAVECEELLRPYGRDLRDATRFFIQHLESQRRCSIVPTIREAVVEYLLLRKRDYERHDIAKRTLQGLTHALRQLVAAAGDLPINEFDADKLRTYLDSFPCSAKSRQDYRLRLSSLFTYAKSKKWIAANPCSEVRVRVPRQEVVILSVEQAENLLRHAERSKHAAYLAPYVACCLLGGLRPFEAAGLDWKDVDFETNHIHVLAHTSKKREGRYVTMEPALVAFLQPHARANGRVVASNGTD